MNQVKDTIRKLLNLAKDDAATEGEIANALRFANRLMDKHNLSEEDLPQADEKLLEIERAECATYNAFSGSGRVAHWEKTLATFVSQFTHVPVYQQTGAQEVRKNGIVQLTDSGTVRKAGCFVFYGLVEDAQLATEIYDELRVTIAAIARLKYGSVYRASGREYCEGFVQGLMGQVKQAQLPQASDCRALVVARNEIVEAKQTRAREFLAGQGVRLRRKTQRRSVRKRDAGAYSTGHKDGTNHQVSTNRKKRIPNG